MNFTFQSLLCFCIYAAIQLRSFTIVCRLARPTYILKITGIFFCRYMIIDASFFLPKTSTYLYFLSKIIREIFNWELLRGSILHPIYIYCYELFPDWITETMSCITVGLEANSGTWGWSRETCVIWRWIEADFWLEFVGSTSIMLTQVVFWTTGYP